MAFAEKPPVNSDSRAEAAEAILHALSYLAREADMVGLKGLSAKILKLAWSVAGETKTWPETEH